ncbi:MAG: hypothetical protein PHC51_13995 [bacterium]|nr:hypothetical protein [bacterium]
MDLAEQSTHEPRTTPWILLAISALLGCYILRPIEDPDLWWHIVVGRWILYSRTLPTQDLWNCFSGNSMWHAYSWLFEISVAIAELAGGIQGLLLLKTLLAISLALAAVKIFVSVSQDKITGMIIAALCTAAMVNHFALRPQCFSWVLFILLTGISELHRSQRLPRHFFYIYTFVLGSLWANTNITSAIGLAALVPWGIRPLLLFFAGTLATPHLGLEWMTFANKATHPIRFLSIREFQPANFYDPAAGICLILLVLYYLICHLYPRQRPVLFLAAPGILFIAGMTFSKFLPFAVIYSALLLARELGELNEKEKNESDLLFGLELLKERLLTLPEGSIAVGVFLSLLLCFVFSYPVFKHPTNNNITPVAAYNFIEKERLPEPLAHTFQDGGYVMFRRSSRQGEIKSCVAIDGRTNVTPPEVFDMHQESFDGTRNWSTFIEKAQAETILWPNSSPLPTILQLSNQWRSVYDDSTNAQPRRGYSIFVTRDYYESQAQRFEFP